MAPLARTPIPRAEDQLRRALARSPVGVEIKRVDAPRPTRSMAVALEDLKLDALRVVYPGTMAYRIDDRVSAVPAREPFLPVDAHRE